jgi:hypothetical protein
MDQDQMELPFEQSAQQLLDQLLQETLRQFDLEASRDQNPSPECM